MSNEVKDNYPIDLDLYWNINNGINNQYDNNGIDIHEHADNYPLDCQLKFK